MPFKSSAQMKYIYAKHPSIAKRWSKEMPEKYNLPDRVKIRILIAKKKRGK